MHALHIVAFSCIILLKFAINFPKHHQKKPQNDCKNGRKNGHKQAKMAKNGSKMILSLGDVDAACKGATNGQKGSKMVEKGQKAVKGGKKRLKSHLDLHQIA